VGVEPCACRINFLAVDAVTCQSLRIRDSADLHPISLTLWKIAD